jgi:hypothetical protein
MVQLWNILKAVWSIIISLIDYPEREPIKQFDSPEQVAEYLAQNFIYTGDPLNGAGDFYTHPQVMQAAFTAGRVATSNLWLDCDDCAVYAYAALKTVPGCRPLLYTIYDSSGNWGHHVICGFKIGEKYGVIDVNGLNELPSLNTKIICELFTNIYKSRGYVYTSCIYTPFPFRM